ncbi:MAG: hypothetical protein A2V67_13830 [Deltaproteobacteria bacterium RBG_13_61_14]|nr:MAG: hypothetical protein A2V67_13830 [Deltaproteobacteria bacterium RBG_13_61_14]
MDRGFRSFAVNTDEKGSETADDFSLAWIENNIFMIAYSKNGGIQLFAPADIYKSCVVRIISFISNHIFPIFHFPIILGSEYQGF